MTSNLAKNRRERERERERDRQCTAAARAALLLALTLAARSGTCQSEEAGKWANPGFNHELTGPHVLNDYTAPFQGTNYQPPPSPPAVGANATANYFWGQGNLFVDPVHRQAFNAVHMALIPKGPHHGKVLVWGSWYPVLLRPNSTLEPLGNMWWCQAWSIIDVLAPTGPRFLNYLLPLAPTPPPNGQGLLEVLFCAGHAWDQNGNLVVAGGASSFVNLTAIPPTPVPGSGVGGAKFFYLFDPAASSQPFSSLANLYAGHRGHWQRNTDLLFDRFYPSVTLSNRLFTRLNGGEVVVIAGGSSQSPAQPSPFTYETYRTTPIATGVNSILTDLDPSVPQTLFGPNSGQGALEYFDEYPRLHQLSDGSMFLSGPAPLASKGFQDAYAQGNPLARPWIANARDFQPQAQNSTPTNPQPFPNQWDWASERHDGASLLACMNGLDIVIKLGGGDSAVQTTGGTLGTDTAEYCVGNDPSPVWQPLPVPLTNPVTLSRMPGGPRQFPNAVALPDGSFVVIGGLDPLTVTYTTKTALYRSSTGWSTIKNGDTPTRRAYHSTAILLPDATVLVGGGELSTPQFGNERDYDIYVPHYLMGNPTRPTITAIKDSQGANLPLDPATVTAQTIATGQSGVVHCSGLPSLTSLAQVVLMAPGSITHHSDMSARYVLLAQGQGVRDPVTGNWTMPFTIPANGSVPRGFYMMFALNSMGVPSVARWIQVI